MAAFHELEPIQQKAILVMTELLVDPYAGKKTYKQIAEEIGVSTSILHKWRTSDKKFQQARIEISQSYANEMVAEGFAALRRQINDNDNVKAVEVLFKSQGMLVNKVDLDADINGAMTVVFDEAMNGEG